MNCMLLAYSTRKLPTIKRKNPSDIDRNSDISNCWDRNGEKGIQSVKMSLL